MTVHFQFGYITSWAAACFSKNENATLLPKHVDFYTTFHMSIIEGVSQTLWSTKPEVEGPETTALKLRMTWNHSQLAPITKTTGGLRIRTTNLFDNRLIMHLATTRRAEAGNNYPRCSDLPRDWKDINFETVLNPLEWMNYYGVPLWFMSPSLGAKNNGFVNPCSKARQHPVRMQSSMVGSRLCLN